MRILVTGVTGFVGQRLALQLSPTDEIYVICRNQPQGLPDFIKVILVDLNDEEELAKRLKHIRPDTCVHLAWQDIPDYSFETSFCNLKRSVALLRLLVEECGCRKIVAAGSCWEYGKSFGLCRESDPVSSSSYFVWAKRSLADFGEMLAAKNGITFVWMRFFYVYGPGQRSGSIIPLLAEALRKQERPAVKTPGNANDFIYVDDIAEALALAVRKNVPTGIYNLGSGQSVAVWKVCESIEKAMGRQPEFAKQLQQINIQPTANFWADMSKFNSVLGWNARINIEEGIRRYVIGIE